MLHKHSVLLFLLFLQISTYQIQEKVSLERISSPAVSTLGFSNRTGACVMKEELMDFKTAAFQASWTLLDSNQTSFYIKGILNARHGTPIQGFSVFVQKTNGKTGIAVYSLGGCSFAELVGVSLNPLWSYFYIENTFTSRSNFSSIAVNSKGNGISLSLEAAMKAIILDNEKETICQCDDSLEIQIDLESYDKQKWNVICFSDDLAGVVLVKDGQWIVMKAKVCNYLLWVLS